MKNIKNILCAVDLSEQSIFVAEYAKQMAKAFGAEVCVVYAAPVLSHYSGFHVSASTIESFVGEVLAGAEKNMQDFITDNFAGIKAKGKVLNGYAADEILRQAKEINADLIVMGTHGRKGVDRLLFGSVAEKVVKGAHVPVLTVKPVSNS